MNETGIKISLKGKTLKILYNEKKSFLLKNYYYYKKYIYITYIFKSKENLEN